MRTVYYIAWTHGRSELGREVFTAIKRNADKHFGAGTCDAIFCAADKIWRRTRRKLGRIIASGTVATSNLYVFADSLYAIGNRSLAWTFSRRHRSNRFNIYIRRLRKLGATLCPTDDEELHDLHALVLAYLGNGTPQDKHLMHERDKTMAKNIARQLPDGATAFVFMGTAHLVDKVLRKIAPDIHIIYVTTREESAACFNVLTPKARTYFRSQIPSLTAGIFLTNQKSHLVGDLQRLSRYWLSRPSPES